MRQAVFFHGAGRVWIGGHAGSCFFGDGENKARPFIADRESGRSDQQSVENELVVSHVAPCRSIETTNTSIILTLT